MGMNRYQELSDLKTAMRVGYHQISKDMETTRCVLENQKCQVIGMHRVGGE